MATNCTSENLRPRPRPCDEALAWVSSALRSEKLIRALESEDSAEQHS
jgi:hypothetical protein